MGGLFVPELGILPEKLRARLQKSSEKAKIPIISTDRYRPNRQRYEHGNNECFDAGPNLKMVIKKAGDQPCLKIRTLRAIISSNVFVDQLYRLNQSPRGA